MRGSATPSRAKGSSLTPRHAGGVTAASARPASARIGEGGSHTPTTNRKTPVASPRPITSLSSKDLSKGPRGVSASASPRPMSIASPFSAGSIDNKYSHLGGTLAGAGNPLYGERFEPTTYQTLFSFSGSYGAVACVPASASIWAANTSNGCLDIFSSCTGKLTSSLHARILISTVSGLTPSRFPAHVLQRSNPKEQVKVPKPTALHATATHVWAGYDNGNVVIYDHLVHTAVTEGCFHQTEVKGFCSFSDGTTVSASVDGVLVHWDHEANHFEAITRVHTRKDSDPLSCVISAGTCWVVFCGFESGAIHLTDVSNGKHWATQRMHTKRVTSLAVVRELLFSSSLDKTLNVWRYDVSPLPPNTYTLTGSGGSHIHSLKLLRRIQVNPVVTNLSLDPSTMSLWVLYDDGLMERWSANQDDDFGVEEVVREGMAASPGQKVIAMCPVAAVDTMQVLSLASNGLNHVWYGHYNTLEEKMNKSIASLNAVIEQDSFDTSAWRRRMEELKSRERYRKERYVLLLATLNAQRLMLTFMERWKRVTVHRRASSARLLHRDVTERVNYVARRAAYGLGRKYFTLWSLFHDSVKRRELRRRAAVSLEAASKRALLNSAYERWMSVMVKQHATAFNRQSVVAVERVNRAALLSRYYLFWWNKVTSRRRAVQGEMMFTEDQLRVLQSRSRLQVMQRAMQKWCRYASSSSNQRLTMPYVSPLSRFADSYSKIRENQLRRSYYQRWMRWKARRQKVNSLHRLSPLLERQQHVNLAYRYFVQWSNYLQEKSLDRREKEVEAIQKQTLELRDTHKDAFERLQLRQRIDKLRADSDISYRCQQDDEEQVEKLTAEVQRLREQLSHRQENHVAAQRMAASPNSHSGSWYRELLAQQRLLPSVLIKMTLEDAVHHVISQLKGNVINLYHDMALFQQVNEQRKSGRDAALIFSDALVELKRMVVLPAKASSPRRTNASPTASNTRWPLFLESLDSIPVHHCWPILQCIKTLPIAHDLVLPEGARSLTAVYEELVLNADWIFLLFRACRMRKRASFSVNSQVSSILV